MITGSGNGNGYRRLRICGKNHYLHHVVRVLVTGKKPEGHIDHIDGDTQNNSHHNLRDVDRSTNMHNSKAKGYSWHAASKSWRARITVNGNERLLGYFKTVEAAKDAYEAAKKHHGFIYKQKS